LFENVSELGKYCNADSYGWINDGNVGLLTLLFFFFFFFFPFPFL
jgi:hypothetical protein